MSRSTKPIRYDPCGEALMDYVHNKDVCLDHQADQNTSVSLNEPWLTEIQRGILPHVKPDEPTVDNDRIIIPTGDAFAAPIPIVDPEDGKPYTNPRDTESPNYNDVMWTNYIPTNRTKWK